MKIWEIISYLDDGGLIACPDVETRNQVFDFLAAHGFSVGFDQFDHEYDIFTNVYYIGGYLHARKILDREYIFWSDVLGETALQRDFDPSDLSLLL